MARFPLRSAAGAAILVFVGAAYVLAARPEHRGEFIARQDEGMPPPVTPPTQPQENRTVNAQTQVTRHVPPIDLTQPKKIETATFALG